MYKNMSMRSKVVWSSASITGSKVKVRIFFPFSTPKVYHPIMPPFKPFNSPFNSNSKLINLFLISSTSDSLKKQLNSSVTRTKIPNFNSQDSSHNSIQKHSYTHKPTNSNQQSHKIIQSSTTSKTQHQSTRTCNIQTKNSKPNPTTQSIHPKSQPTHKPVTIHELNNRNSITNPSTSNQQPIHLTNPYRAINTRREEDVTAEAVREPPTQRRQHHLQVQTGTEVVNFTVFCRSMVVYSVFGDFRLKIV